MATDKPSYIIVGSGIFGASAAYHLSQTGRFSSITLIDRGPFPCPLGASYDYQKVIRADYGDSWYMSLGVEAQRAWRADALFSPFYHESGVVYVEGAADGLAWKKKRNWDESGIPNTVAVLKANELIQRYPLFHDADFSTDPDCYVNPESGWAEATACLRAVIQAAVDNGVVYVQGRVTKLLFGVDGDCSGVEVDDGSNGNRKQFHASKTLLAAGGTTPKILADSATDPRRPELQVKNCLLGAAVVTGALTLTPEQVDRLKGMPVFIHRDGVTHGEIYPPTADKVLKFCRDISFANTYRHSGTGELISTPPEDDHHNQDQSYAPQKLKDEIALVMKGILGREAEGLEIQSYRVCWDTFTPAQDFIISPHPSAPSLHFATGGSFHSWKFLPVIGKYVVQSLEGTLDAEHAERWSWAKAQRDAENLDKGKGAQSMLQPQREWKDLVRESETNPEVVKSGQIPGEGRQFNL